MAGLLLQVWTGCGEGPCESDELFCNAAAQDFAPAQNNLAILYWMGVGVVKDVDKALKWFRRSAINGDAAGQRNLAGILWDGSSGVHPNKREAGEWYGKLLKQECVNLMLRRAQSNDSKAGGTPNYEEAFRWYKKAAQLGNAFAQFCIAECYRTGERRRPGRCPGSGMVCQIGRDGFKAAQHNLGFFFQKGIGVSQDHSKAAHWFQKAAEQGCAHSQCELGEAYRLGWGVRRDPVVAAALYERAANQGHSKAAHWFQKAAEQGSADSQCELGDAYSLGLGRAQRS